MIDPNARYWFEYTDATGAVWKVDWVGVYRILRAYARAKEVLNHSQIIKKIENPEYAQVGGAISVEYLHVDWSAVERGADIEAARLAQDIWNNWLPTSGERTFCHLVGLREDTLKYEKQFWKKSNDAWKKTLPSIESTVKTLETVKKGLEIVRDTSADILMVGATFLSGGAAAGILGARGFIKGAARYADTENIGFAVLEGTAQFIFGLAKWRVGTAQTAGQAIGGALSKQNLLLCFTEANYEVGMALGSGKSIEEAIKRGALKMSEPLLGAAFGSLLSKLDWSRLLFPLSIKASFRDVLAASPGMATVVARRVPLEGAKALLEKKMPALPRTLPQPAISDGYVPAESIIRNMIQRVPRSESGRYFPNIPEPPMHR